VIWICKANDNLELCIHNLLIWNYPSISKMVQDTDKLKWSTNRKSCDVLNGVIFDDPEYSAHPSFKLIFLMSNISKLPLVQDTCSYDATLIEIKVRGTLCNDDVMTSLLVTIINCG